MAESLFNEYEAQTTLGNALAREVRIAMTPIIMRHAAVGYSLREISDIVHGEVASLINEEVLRKAVRMHRQQRIKGG